MIRSYRIYFSKSHFLNLNRIKKIYIDQNNDISILFPIKHAIFFTDIQPPSIQCPSDMEMPTETGQSYRKVTWKVPVPFDNSKEQPILSGLLPPQKLNVGRNYINYSATDSSGLKSFCRFLINVKGKHCSCYRI